MNLPLDKIHDVRSGYGRLLVPLRAGRWLMWRRGKFAVTSRFGFHNCRTTGVQ